MWDLPPITSFSTDNARSDGRFRSGDSVALTCTWLNTENTPIKFTTEDKRAEDIMCLMAMD